MEERVIWVWCSENLSSHDINNWQMIRKLLKLNERNGDYIIEFQSHRESHEFQSSLENKGWQLDNEVSAGTPNVACWKQSFALID